MEQILIKVGNSLAVTVPKKYVNARKLKAGQKVFVETDENLDLMQIKTRNRNFTNLTPEFRDWLNKVSKKNESLIKELAKQ